MTQNPFVAALIYMLARQWALALAGAIGLAPIVKPLIDQYASEFTQAVIGALLFVVTAGYAALRKFWDRQKLVTALASTVPMSEQDAKAMVKDPHIYTPSVSTPKNEVPA